MASSLMSRVHVKHRELWKAQDGRCFYCDVEMLTEIIVGMNKQARKPKLVTRDHFVPRLLGGTLAGNVVLACVACNSRAAHALPSVDEVERFATLYRVAGLSPMLMLPMLASAARMVGCLDQYEECIRRVAQTVEHRILIPAVGGSNPPALATAMQAAFEKHRIASAG